MASNAFDAPSILERNRDSFPSGRWLVSPKMEYHVFADAVFWADEFPAEMPTELENAFRLVLNHRTSLLVGEIGRFDEVWAVAQKYFPSWVGFAQERCSYDPEIADRIRRIRRVANWRIRKTDAELEREDA